MLDLLHAAVSAPNIIPTALLVFVLVYWLVVILGAIDLDFFDIDVEMEAEADVDGELSVSWLNHALAFFNLGQVPFMLFMTFWIVPVWVMAVLGNHYLENESLGFGLLLLVPILIVGLFVAKFLTAPFVRLFGKLDSDVAHNQSLIGRPCTVTSSASASRTGQARIVTNGAPLLLNVRTPDGLSMRRGDTALVIDYEPQRNVYLVEPYIH